MVEVLGVEVELLLGIEVEVVPNTVVEVEVEVDP